MRAEKPTALMLLCEYVLNSKAAVPDVRLLHHTLLELYLTPVLRDEGLMAPPGLSASSSYDHLQASPGQLLPEARKHTAAWLRRRTYICNPPSNGIQLCSTRQLAIYLVCACS